MRFCAVTLGCKVNQYETQAIESVLSSRGHILADAGSGCDVCVINTCAVTAESARKSRQAVRRMKKLEPEALIAVCGCLSQLEAGTAADIGADLIGGSGDRIKFAEEIEFLSGSGGSNRQSAVLTDDPFERLLFEELPSGGAINRTRAMIKIQDGCDNFCAYCIIPYARGHVRSLPIERAAEHARKLHGEGYRELVITGIEISSYGRELEGNATLADVVRAIGEAAPGVRLRLGSLDPSAVTDFLCGELAEVPGLCGHFHLSLQSGCDETLRRMRRKYDTAAVLHGIELLRCAFPDCGLTADLITGFPGETDAEFYETIKFIEQCGFSDMHIFPYSERPGTPAADMPGQIEKQVRRERARIAARSAEEMSAAFRQAQIGKTAEVLFERKRGGAWTGFTRNYVEVSVKGETSRNCVHSVQITGVCDGVVWGEI